MRPPLTEEQKARKRVREQRYRAERHDKYLAKARQAWASRTEEQKVKKRVRDRRYRAAQTEERTAHEQERLRQYAVKYRDQRNTKLRAFRAKRRAMFYVGGCVDSGAHAGHLEFHHRDPATKLFNIARSLTFPLPVLRAEIAKCDLICERHHRLRHRALRKKAA